jgi:8-amino-7-oxononanoate synthase
LNRVYLDLSGDRRVNEAAATAIGRYGTSVSASRLASGERPIHRELEAELAATLGTDDALVFVGGHATNVTVIGHLLGRKDLVLHDELVRNSVLQGCILASAHRVKIPHNDWAAADAYLAAHRGKFERVLSAMNSTRAVSRATAVVRGSGCGRRIDRSVSI